MKLNTHIYDKPENTYICIIYTNTCTYLYVYVHTASCTCITYMWTCRHPCVSTYNHAYVSYQVGKHAAINIKLVLPLRHTGYKNTHSATIHRPKKTEMWSTVAKGTFTSSTSYSGNQKKSIF